MAWVRWGDGSAMHPLLLTVLEHPECDDRLVNEVHGFVSRCAAQSGQHSTDYVVTRGTAIQVAGPTRIEILTAVCLFAGLFTEVLVADDGRTVIGYKLVDDDPEFLHLRLKKEIEWERQRKADASRPNLIVPVRLRDGDSCRWCGRIVDWNDRKSGRAGTYDHIKPGEEATFDTYVVCCKACNSSRGDGEHPQGVTALLDPPAEPYFSRYTVKWLTENKWRISEGLPVPDPAARYIPPGRLVDGSQPPTPDQSTTTGSRTRVAPSAPSDDQTRVAPTAPSDPDPAPTRVAPTAPSDSGLVTSQTPADLELTRVAPTAPSVPDRTPTTSATTPETARSDRYLLDPDRSGQIAGVRDLSELVGSGRDGSGRDGSPDPSHSQESSDDRPRPRGGRRRRNSKKVTPRA